MYCDVIPLLLIKVREGGFPVICCVLVMGFFLYEFLYSAVRIFGERLVKQGLDAARVIFLSEKVGP